MQQAAPTASVQPHVVPLLVTWYKGTDGQLGNIQQKLSKSMYMCNWGSVVGLVLTNHVTLKNFVDKSVP